MADDYFAALPKAMLSDKRVKGTHLRVAGVIALHDRRSLALGKGEGCYASVYTLAGEAGIDPKNCRSAIKDLVSWDYAQRTSTGANRPAVLRIIYAKTAGLETPRQDDELGVSTPPRYGSGDPQNYGSGDPPKRNERETTREDDSPNRDFLFSGDQSEPSPVDRVIEHWKAIAVPAGAQSIRKVNSERRRLINARLKSDGLKDILAAIDRISKSSWATGGEDGKGFKVTIDWLLRAGKVNAVLEGQHDDFRSKRKGTKPMYQQVMAERAREAEQFDGFC